jgi:hypothetical protein
MARRCALDLWCWLSQGGTYPSQYPRDEVDAHLRGVMLATEYMGEDFKEDHVDSPGEERQRELF